MQELRSIMNRRDFLRRCVKIGVGGFLLSDRALAARQIDRPNIVLIVSDDQGYADISCYDHSEEVSTPNIDRLAHEGVRLTNGYASAYVCAPTRAGLLTGRYQQRFGFYAGGDSRVGLPLSEVTVADLLKKQGYATAIVGKWHVGIEPKYRPLERGFDEFYGFLGHGAHDYFNLQITDEYTSIYRNDKPINDTGYLTHNLTREAVSFIERHRAQPFFLYMPFSAVHWPLQAPQEYVKSFNTSDKNRDIYLAMLVCMDEGIGKVLDALKRTGVGENTLIVFFSDNGGAKRNFANNGILRDYKQSVYEGGIRVPFIVSWPRKLQKGTVCSEPIISLDVTPTILSAAGVDLPRDRVYDGKNMLPFLGEEIKSASGRLHKALFWDDGSDQWAVRAGKWKLISRRGSLELYDLEVDVGEKHNLVAEQPHVLKELRDLYDQWRSQMRKPISRQKKGRRQDNRARNRPRVNRTGDRSVIPQEVLGRKE